MHSVFRSFVAGLSESVDRQDLCNTFTQVSYAFDLRCFAYLSMPKCGRAKADLISTYPKKWTAHYLQQHYERLDPVVQHASLDPEPFEWGRGVGLSRISKRQQGFFDEAAEFGICYGFTIPLHGNRGPLAALTFAVDERSTPFRRCVHKKRKLLQLLAILFDTRARLILNDDRTIAGVKLSPRQIECLRWSAQGKSMSDIACILGITPRTVSFHVESAKAKLGVRTICQAVALLGASERTLG